MAWFSSPKRLFRNLVLLVGSMFLVYSIHLAQRDQAYVNYNNIPCKQSSIDLQNLVQLTFEVHTVLNKLKIDHWLMYGSVLGALRVQGPLPWDYDVDIGIRGEQFLNIGKKELLRKLESRGILVCIDWFSRNGAIALCKPEWKLMLDVYPFYDYTGTMKRAGWATWLRFINYRLHHTFPSKLVKAPLPETKFGFFNMPVPHGKNEITKYLYRYDWWKEMKPLGCDKIQSS